MEDIILIRRRMLSPSARFFFLFRASWWENQATPFSYSIISSSLLPISRESRSRYRRMEHHFSRQAYLRKQCREMNKTFYLFQRKIFLNRLLEYGREENLGPLLSPDRGGRHSDCVGRVVSRKNENWVQLVAIDDQLVMADLLVGCISRNLIFRPLDSGLYRPTSMSEDDNEVILYILSRKRGRKWPDTLRISAGISVARYRFRHDQ